MFSQLNYKAKHHFNCRNYRIRSILGQPSIYPETYIIVEFIIPEEQSWAVPIGKTTGNVT